jgi:hypothetical protein
MCDVRNSGRAGPLAVGTGNVGGDAGSDSLANGDETVEGLLELGTRRLRLFREGAALDDNGRRDGDRQPRPRDEPDRPTMGSTNGAAVAIGATSVTATIAALIAPQSGSTTIRETGNYGRD